MREIFRIALRNVLRNRRRSLITLSAVFLALGVMTSIRGFLNGLQASFREQVVYGMTGALQVLPGRVRPGHRIMNGSRMPPS